MVFIRSAGLACRLPRVIEGMVWLDEDIEGSSKFANGSVDRCRL